MSASPDAAAQGAAPSSAARERLADLIAEKAVVRGTVTLSSGEQAEHYVDLRRSSLDGESAALIGPVLLDLAAGWDFEAVGGLTLGADPVALAVVHAANARGWAQAHGGKPLDAFVVRKAEKTHGLQRRIEGPDVTGRRVLAVEDTSTTGGSVLTAVEALREAGADVVGVLVLVDRDTGAKERVEAAGLPYRAAFGLADIGLGGGA